MRVQSRAGAAIGFSDDDYRAAGAQIAADAGTVFAAARLLIRVKEPLAEERARLRSGQAPFTYLHLAADRAQTASCWCSSRPAGR